MSLEIRNLLVSIISVYGMGAYIYWIACRFAPENIIVKSFGVIYKPAFELFEFAKLRVGNGYIDLSPVCINIVLTLVFKNAINVLYNGSILGG